MLEDGIVCSISLDKRAFILGGRIAGKGRSRTQASDREKREKCSKKMHFAAGGKEQQLSERQVERL